MLVIVCNVGKGEGRGLVLYSRSKPRLNLCVYQTLLIVVVYVFVEIDEKIPNSYLFREPGNIELIIRTLN